MRFAKYSIVLEYFVYKISKSHSPGWQEPHTSQPTIRMLASINLGSSCIGNYTCHQSLSPTNGGGGQGMEDVTVNKTQKVGNHLDSLHKLQ